MWLGAIVIDTDNAERLSDFYCELLNWEKSIQENQNEKWIILMDKEHRFTPLVFQENPEYQKPIYPAENDKQQQMIHLDFYVKHNELEDRIKHALECGAVLADVQYSEDWKVFLDLSGHPFCIIPIPENTPWFAD